MKKIVHNKSAEKKLVGEGVGSKIVSFAKSKPYFVLAAVFSIFLVALFVYNSSIVPEQITQEEADYVNSIFVQNNSDLNEMLTNVNEELLLEQATTLDDDYLNSVKDDIEWLTQKQKTIYYTSNRNDVLINELAFSVLMQKIIDVDTYFAYDLGTPDYESKITEAKTVELVGENFFKKSDLNQLFSDSTTQQKFFNSLNSVLSDYEKSRRLLIDNTNSVERKFVESKKLVLLSKPEEETTTE